MRFRTVFVSIMLLVIVFTAGLWTYARPYIDTHRTSWSRMLIEKYGLVKMALALSPKDASVALRAGNFYLGEKAHDLQKAEALYKRALELGYPEPTYVYFGLSRAYFFEGRYNKAIGAINETLRLDPSVKNAYYMRGLIYGYKNSLSEAERDFAKFLELKPESWAGANDLAWIYFRQGRYADIVPIMERSLKYNPENPWLHNSLGVALLNTGEKGEAKIAFEVALAGFEKMTPEEWGKAYPGNDARYHTQGLAITIRSVEKNILLLSTSTAGMIQ